MSFIRALFASLLAVASAQANQAPLAYEAAFGAKTFKDATVPVFVLSPAGNRLAYVVYDKPADYGSNNAGATRFSPEGTPHGAVGLTIHVMETTGKDSVPLCARDLAGANSWRPSWSPDGSKLAFYSDVGGAPQLWIYEVSSNSCKRASAAPIRARHWGGDEPQWSPDGRTVYVPLRPENLKAPVAPPAIRAANPGEEAAVVIYCGGSEKDALESQCSGAIGDQDGESGYAHFLWENNAHLGSVDVDSGVLRVVVNAESSPRPSVVRVSPTGRWISYLSVYYTNGDGRLVHDLAFADVRGGDARLLAQALPVPERDYYRLSYRWHPTRDRLVYLKDDRLFLVDFDETGPGAPQALGPELGVLSSRVLLFTPDGNSLLVGVSPQNDALGRRADGRPASYALVPIDGGEAIRLSVEDEYLLEEPLGPAPGTLRVSEDGDVLVRALHEKTGEAVVLSLDVEAGASKVIWSAGARLSSPAVAPDGEIFAVYSDNRTPPDIFRFSGSMNRRTRLTEINPVLPEVDTGELHVFSTVVPFHDGTLQSVRTMVRMPPGAEPGDRPPGVVYIYPESSYLAEALSFGIEGNPLPAALLTTRGYAVIYATVDIGPGNEAGNVIQEITNALLPQVRRAADLGFVDIRRLAITGSSFGGFSTAAVVSQTNLFRAAVPMNAPYDLGGNYGLLGKRLGAAPMVYWTEHVQPRIGGPIWSDLDRVIRNSPYYNADKIHTPMLIMQGGDDLFLAEAQKLFVALRRLDRPVRLAIYQDSGHVLSDWPRAQAIDGAARIVEFLGRHLQSTQTSRE